MRLDISRLPHCAPLGEGDPAHLLLRMGEGTSKRAGLPVRMP